MSHAGRKRRTRSLLAVLAAGALSLGTLLGTAPANAAPSYGNIDKSASGSIIVHKHENQVGSDAVQDPEGAGTAIPSAPVPGVEFTAYEIVGPDGKPVDLSVPRNWDHLEDLKVSADGKTLTGGPAAPTGPWTVGAAKAHGTTDSKGEVTLDLASVGAYVVVETDGPAQVVQAALPFIVTIPFPYEDGWLYDVNVYPKNGLAGIEKSVSPQGTALGLGSTVSFPVTTKVPGLAPGTTFDNYVVEDTLDARLGKVGVGSVTLDGVDVDPTYYRGDVTGNTVRLAFTKAGLDWLLTQGGKRLVTTFVGTVTSIGDGVIENQATLFVNDPSESNGIVSNEVHTSWGDLAISKTDASSSATGLAGAVFEVYAAQDPYATDCSAARPTGAALQVEGGTRFTSNAEGRIDVAGLFVSDSVNDTADAAQRCYVLKEVEAPAGFVTPTGDAALTGVAVTPGATTGVDVTIENVQQGVPELPMTGGTGRSTLVVGGLAVLALALGLMLVSRRRAAKH